MEGMQADPYKVLGLHSDASPEEIKKVSLLLVMHARGRSLSSEHGLGFSTDLRHPEQNCALSGAL